MVESVQSTVVLVLLMVMFIFVGWVVVINFPQLDAGELLSLRSFSAVLQREPVEQAVTENATSTPEPMVLGDRTTYSGQPVQSVAEYPVVTIRDRGSVFAP